MVSGCSHERVFAFCSGILPVREHASLVVCVGAVCEWNSFPEKKVIDVFPSFVVPRVPRLGLVGKAKVN